MKLHGDAPKEDQELADKLVKAESDYMNNDGLSKERKAMFMVCLAHDWFDINMEEEGLRLLDKAETVRPGYFKEVQPKDMKDHANYTILVLRLASFLTGLKEDLQ